VPLRRVRPYLLASIGGYNSGNAHAGSAFGAGVEITLGPRSFAGVSVRQHYGLNKNYDYSNYDYSIDALDFLLGVGVTW